MTGDADLCVNILIKSKRTAEAAFFARAYCPSKLGSVVAAWDEALLKRKLPFQPENIAAQTSGPHQEVLKLAVGIERKIREMLQTRERASAEDYESAMADYFRDLALDNIDSPSKSLHEE